MLLAMVPPANISVQKLHSPAQKPTRPPLNCQQYKVIKEPYKISMLYCVSIAFITVMFYINLLFAFSHIVHGIKCSKCYTKACNLPRLEFTDSFESFESHSLVTSVKSFHHRYKDGLWIDFAGRGNSSNVCEIKTKHLELDKKFISINILPMLPHKLEFISNEWGSRIYINGSAINKFHQPSVKIVKNF